MAFVLIFTNTTQTAGTSGQGAEAVNPDKYVPVVLDLFPQGPLWSRELDTELAMFCRAVGFELSRSERRGEQLLRELDPSQTVELLPEWEEMMALPDTDGAATDTASRQQAVHEKYASVGGISPDFLAEVADKLGYEIEVEHGGIFVGDSACGDAVDGTEDEGAKCGEAVCSDAVTFAEVIIHTKAGGNDAQFVSAMERFFHAHFVLTVLYDLP